MEYKVGNYIHAVTSVGSSVVKGTVTSVNEDGTLLLSNGETVNPKLSEIVVFENVSNIDTLKQIARAESIRRHPAGKGLKR
jgi:repressor of nif and glnA expression